ncbi:MAG: helicase [Oceanospirillaceae bacterium]|nr:helicase [Oceanospirillaceae bacterium]MBT14360.1 helicase [Oceanospirillaceae bacterium]|tara:strand:- start:41356 stop:44385 length:3030 start_codon:yes stop_codon:yes gene_type:complete
MSLINTLKDFLGISSEAVANSDGFISSADSDGINFYLPQEDFKALNSGVGEPRALLQLALFKMLEEQGSADPMANGYSVPSPVIAALKDDEANVLMLPDFFNGAFEARIQSKTTDSAFTVDIYPRLTERVPLKVKGPLLYIGSEQYRLTFEQLLAIQALNHHQDLSASERGEAENLRLVARLQLAKRSGMQLELAQFDSLAVRIPEKIGITATRLADGSLELCPAVGAGISPDDLGSRWHQLEKASDEGVLRVKDQIVLLEPEKLQAVNEVLSRQRIPASQVADFIKTPSAFIDAALVDLDLGFSLRVEGIGELQHIDFGNPDASRQDWFALGDKPMPAEIIRRLVDTPEELQSLQKKIEQAQQLGATQLQFAGENIDISNSGQVAALVTELNEKFSTPQEPQSTPEESLEQDEETVTSTVILKEADERVATLKQKLANAKNTSVDWQNCARQPFDHQREGVDWMARLISAASADNPEDFYRVQGGLLADDMGLGKTYMALVAAQHYLQGRKSAGKTEKPILVVAPLSLLENWEDEVSKTFNSIPFRDIVVLQSGRDLKQYRIQGAERESQQLQSLADSDAASVKDAIRYALKVGPSAGPARLDMDRRLVLTTYQTLRDYQFSLCVIDWGMVIFDEAQNLKNINTLQTRAAKGLKADVKILATGTPVENSLADYWCLVDTAQPGLLGDWPQFRDSWIKPILNAVEEERDEVRVQIGTDLRNAVGDYMLRRTKEERLTGLPVKTIISGLPQSQPGIQQMPALARTMTGAQLQAYDAAIEHYRTVRTETDTRGVALAVLSQLRGISLHPELSNIDQLLLSVRSADDARQQMMLSAKLQVLLGILDDIRSKNEKIILFMITKNLQRAVKLWLDKIYGLNISVINGDTKAVQTKSEELSRKQLITQFEAQPGFNILIMSPVAAGVGLTVIGANHVVHLERHWNPAKEAQASDRVYRIGQKKPVSIYLPAALHPEHDAFDVHLDRLLQGKLMLKDAVVTTEGVAESAMAKALGL